MSRTIFEAGLILRFSHSRGSGDFAFLQQRFQRVIHRAHSFVDTALDHGCQHGGITFANDIGQTVCAQHDLVSSTATFTIGRRQQKLRYDGTYGIRQGGTYLGLLSGRKSVN